MAAWFHLDGDNYGILVFRGDVDGPGMAVLSVAGESGRVEPAAVQCTDARQAGAKKNPPVVLRKRSLRPVNGFRAEGRPAPAGS